jgi:hypothetical protein
VTALAWHPRDALLLAGDERGHLRGWNWPDIRPFTPAAAAGAAHAHRGAIWTLRWSADGKTLWSSGHDGEVKAWDRASDSARTFAHLPDLALGMDVSADGAWLAAASTDGVIRVWPTAGERGTAMSTLPADVADSGHRGSIGALAFAPGSGMLYSGGNDGSVRAWDVASRRLRAVSPAAGAGVQVESIAVSGDGRALASIGSDGELRVWDAVTLEPLMAVRMHRGPGWRVVWLEDAKQFASAGADGALAALTWSEGAWTTRVRAVLGARE